ncbi:MAG: hypothetical protein U0031_09880 [Thermomicrobiales bacterium]
MLGSALSALSDRVDSKFLTAYWLPAFVFALGGFIILAICVGMAQIDTWIYDLDSVEQSLGVLLIVLLITMVGFVLRALTRPIAEAFSGAGLPRAVADWSTRGQLRAKQRARKLISGGGNTNTAAMLRSLENRFPADDADLQPTLLGNVVASAGEHPRFAYSMEGSLWWPRLAPLLPGYFQDILGGAQAPTMGLLNLTVVFIALAPLGMIVLGVMGSRWVAAIVTTVVVFILARLCYLAAVSQAAELASQLRVAFDLYRYEILNQLDFDRPGDLAAERDLWRRLASEILAIPAPSPPKASADSEPAPTPAETDQSTAGS